MGWRPGRYAFRRFAVTLVDSSAWIEFLRRTRSPAHLRVRELIRLPGEIVICDAVRMEVLAGARSESHLLNLHHILMWATTLPTEPADYDAAAALFRRCQRRGATIRKLIDCLIAAVAIRAGIPILHHDSDFTALARHTELTIGQGSL